MGQNVTADALGVQWKGYGQDSLRPCGQGRVGVTGWDVNKGFQCLLCGGQMKGKE